MLKLEIDSSAGEVATLANEDTDEIEELLGFDEFKHSIAVCASAAPVPFACDDSVRRRVCGTMLTECLKPR